ncbi:transporter substrate-binding domain-containing protein [Burkholderia pseudomultivorans]|uniref:transporter substrate-binding domain-containing protein n=1 Tax=Burkholderia pseudomultivorans TaxID=1207504 RepID=UPI0007546732|nr:transporter substrate-binding domain-containing protein [Burkholderia pseudomultivorans]KVC20932.1 ABC transporter substrate-binding protein [Burkholderia pseudomultivorans]KVC39828.1 ABC transporter substrate-binding protein [Burkholderia pseudomultivorans]
MNSKRRMGLKAAACAFVVAAAAMAAPGEAREWKTVTIALEGSYEPWNLTRPDGTIDGFEPELARNLCGRMRVQCKLMSQDWDGLIPGLNAGKFDVIMDALSISEDRKRAIAFSKPYANTPAVFVSAGPVGLPKALPNAAPLRLTGDPASDRAAVEPLRAALKGKSIGIVTGSVYSAFINRNFKDVASIREYKNAPDHDIDLLNGRIDVAFDDAAYYASALAKPGNAALRIVGPKIGGPIWGDGEALGLRKSDADLKTMFDQAIAAAITDGTVRRLSEKWFKTDVTP